MGKNVGLTYGEFKFPAEQGFTGSAGVHKVRGYMRGGHVKSKAHQKMPANVKMKGGKVHAGEGGYYGKPGDKYPTLKSGPRGKQGSSMPKNVKAKGGYMKGGMHDKLKHEGAKMGYAYGGQVKPSNTSSQFKMTKGKQDTMDHGVQPARRGRNQAEIEAGGTKRLKPGLAKGGVCRVRMAKGTTRAKKGGLAKYAYGGRARKPYTGYNKQPGGSGVEDARYMKGKK